MVGNAYAHIDGLSGNAGGAPGQARRRGQGGHQGQVAGTARRQVRQRAAAKTYCEQSMAGGAMNTGAVARVADAGPPHVTDDCGKVADAAQKEVKAM